MPSGLGVVVQHMPEAFFNTFGGWQFCTEGTSLADSCEIHCLLMEVRLLNGPPVTVHMLEDGNISTRNAVAEPDGCRDSNLVR